MGVEKYTCEQGTFWKINVWVALPDGQRKRIQKRKIPTREQAVALEAKIRAEAFEGRYFERLKVPKVTVAQLWKEWEPISKRDKDSWQSDIARARYLCSILGDRVASGLTQRDVDEYRNRRLREHTRRKYAPSPATLDREIAQLKRMCSYAVECGLVPTNPVARVKLLNKPNVRRVTVDEQSFAQLVQVADPGLRPIVITAYDTGMRKGEILNLRWSQVDLRIGAIKLAAEDTKTNFPRTVYLTSRVIAELQRLPRRLGTDYVFVNPETGTRWEDARKLFKRACRKLGLDHVWFHDLRRSFVTNARRRGVPESVVMRMSGHRTRNVFDRYNIVEDEDVRNAVRVIEAGSLRDLSAGVEEPPPSAVVKNRMKSPRRRKPIEEGPTGKCP